MDGTAVNLTLLPGGTSPFHTRVLWYGLDSDERGLWGWRPIDDACSWSDSNFVTTNFADPPDTINIFCSGMTLLGHSKLGVFGGSDPRATGIGKAAIYDPDADSWTPLGNMAKRRWYPTATLLADGRAYVTGGNQYRHLMCFGGNRSGTSLPSDDELRRFGTSPGGIWDSPGSAYDSDWPSPRSGHAMVVSPSNQPMSGEWFVVGGQDDNGDFQSDAWKCKRVDNAQGLDYLYDWDDLEPSGSAPPGRRDHIMVGIDANKFIVFGGRNGSSAMADVRLLSRDQFDVWSWTQVFPSGTAPNVPRARYGHAAILDAVHSRILIFGGTDSLGAPVDSAVWALHYPIWRWSKPELRGGSGNPGPLYGHRIAVDPRERTRGGNKEWRGLMFGGKDDNGNLPQVAWSLWFSSTPDSTIDWESITLNDTVKPPGRFFHGADMEENGEHPNLARLIVMAGEVAQGLIDSTVWSLEMTSVTNGTWTQLSDAPFAGGRAGHSVVNASVVFPHHPEIFDPVNLSWTSQTSSPLHQYWYPHMFVVPGGNLFCEGPDVPQYSWSVSPAGGNWWKTPTAQNSAVFETAVMYRPGKVMRAGTTTGSGATQTIILDSTLVWKNGANEMFPRLKHNLVLLPNGKVLGVGGTAQGNTNRPQIWDPYVTANGGANVGSWLGDSTGADTLSQDPTVRGYHSTAVLLPDGRVLSAGSGSDPHAANLYCPPYLFKSDGTLKTRPVVTGSPTFASWGSDSFYVYVTDTTYIQSIALIAAPATTHAFDQNQRFVPLQFSKIGGALKVKPPADSTVAPPTAYLLFVLGSQDGADVPAIARWLRMSRDSIPGNTLNFDIDWVATTSLGVYWNANADDHAEAASGRTSQYDFRYKMSAISNETAWSQSNSVTTEPAPLATGSYDTYTFTGFTPCSTYHVAARSYDDVGNISALHGEVSTTMLGTHCGNNLIARPRNELASLRTRGPATTAEGEDARPTEGVLAVETHRTATRGWRVVLRQTDDATTIAGASSDRSIEVQDGSGQSWATSRASEPPMDEGAIGLCRLRDHGRTILRNFFLDGIATRFRTADGTFEIPQADRLDAIPALADGDSLTLEYEPVTSDYDAERWYLMAGRVGGPQLRAAGPRPEVEGQDLPRIYALRQNQPNPFAAMTRISFDLPVPSQARLDIFDLMGRRIRTIVSGSRAAGRYTVEWDRRDETGQTVRPGVYLYSLEAGSFREKKTMVLLK